MKLNILLRLIMQLLTFIYYRNITNHKKSMKSYPVTTKNIYTLHLRLLVHKTLEPCLKEITYILKDAFDFTNKINTDFPTETVFVIADIK